MRTIDRDLVSRVQAGDHDAFEVLVERVVDRLYGTARLILLDQDRAADAAEDTLVTAWREVRRLPDGGAADPWLFGLLLASCRRIGASEGGPRTGQIDPDESRRAFAGLTQDERTILALAYLAELTDADAAVALGVPTATAESRRSGALDTLRTRLEIDDTPTARVDLEWRLRAWLSHEAAPPDLTEVSEAVMLATRSAPQRRRGLIPSPGHRSARAGPRRITRRRLGIAGVGVAVLLLVTTGGILVVRTVRRSEPPPDPAAGILRPTGDLSVLGGTPDRPAVAVLNDGRVLVVGLGDVLLGGVVYDPATDTYGEIVRDEVLRHGSTATTLPNSLVLLTGGTFGGTDASANTAVLFDPVSSTFALTNPMAVARFEHTATLLDDGRVLIVGGRHYPGRGSPALSGRVEAEASTEVYDETTGTIDAAAPMLRARAGHSATKLQDGRVLIAGGYSVSDPEDARVTSGAEIFDPVTGAFTGTGSMTKARTDHSATRLGDGRVLIVGGTDEVGPRGEAIRNIADAEIFDPVTGTFSPVGSLITERAGHSATLLADGRVLVAGGRNLVGDPLSTEIFDPITGTFAPGPTAVAPHHAGLAPVIAGDRVLLTGVGAGASEVFDPHAGGLAGAPSATPGVRPFSTVDTGTTRDRPTLLTLADGRVGILGGATPGVDEPDALVEIFDPATGRTTRAAFLVNRLEDISATPLPDGRIFVAGIDLDSVDQVGGAANIVDPDGGDVVPATDEVAAILHDLHPLAVSGLPDGALVMTDGVDVVEWFDAATGTHGVPTSVCENPRSGILLDAGHLLVSCGSNFDSMTVDLAAGTAEPTRVHFDDALRLDARRIALITDTYDFVGFGRPVPQTRRVSGVYDQVAGTVAPFPEEIPIGMAVTVVGDRIVAFGGGAIDPADDAVSIDARTGLPADIGPMLARRASAAAMPLRDGRVLIVGGGHQSPDRTDPMPSSAELFDPSLTR